MHKLLQTYLSFRPFNDHEAWGIFKIAAIGEAAGWTMLIGGILISKYVTPGNNVAVQIAGHLHGTLFIFYIAGVLLVAPSLRWGPARTIIAGLMSASPYGSLMFELWQSHARRQTKRSQLLSMCFYKQSLIGSTS